MLEAIQFNNNRKNQDLRFFEVGKTYHRQGPSENLSSYEERKHLVMALYGKKFPASWNQPKSEFTFFSLKGIIFSI
jgi:phenylalanyl-tRNA synthetase beta chain